MKITVITVCYNASNTIAQTIESVLAQTYKNIEYIIIDGNSNDGTLDIIKNYDVQYFSEVDHSLYQAFNRGLLKSTGEIVHFLNADDRYASMHILSIIANEFKSHPESDAIFAPLKIAKDNGESRTKNQIADRGVMLKKMQYKMPILHPSTFFRTQVYRDFGFFSDSLKIAGDFDFMCRVVPFVNLHFIDVPCVIMSDQGVSNTQFKRSALEQLCVSMLHSKRIFIPLSYYFSIVVLNFFKKFFPFSFRLFNRGSR